MGSILMAFGAFIAFFIAYNTYGLYAPHHRLGYDS